MLIASKTLVMNAGLGYFSDRFISTKRMVKTDGIVSAQSIFSSMVINSLITKIPSFL